MALAVGVGLVVGLLSGLLGIGGGTLVVPFLYLLMAHPEWSGVVVAEGHQVTLAHATSLAVIVPTAWAGLLAFRRSDLVDWEIVVRFGGVAALTAALGAQMAASVPGELLRTIFGFLLLWIGARMSGIPGLGARTVSFPEKREGRDASDTPHLRPGVAVAGGGIVGFLSALLGIGGGVLAVPILLRWARLDLHRVAAASIGIVAFAAPAGILSYAWAGQGVEGLPTGSLGYVSLPLAAILVPGAMLAAPVGARLNQRLPAAPLRRLYGVALLLVGGRLLLPLLEGLSGG